MTSALYAGSHWHPKLPASANYKNSPIAPLPSFTGPRSYEGTRDRTQSLAKMDEWIERPSKSKVSWDDLEQGGMFLLLDHPLMHGERV
jgi:hypothetical protein